MGKTLITALALTAMALMSNAARAEMASHRDAVAFVEHTKIGQNFPVVALSAAMQTVTFAVLASKLGNEGAVKAVRDEIGALLPIYQAKWDENIAEAYEKSFTEEELSSLASEGRASKYASKVAEQQSAVGKQMNLTSKQILADLVTQALSAAMSKNP